MCPAELPKQTDKMKKASINFKAVTSYSEQHNQRLVIPDYIIPGDGKIPKNISVVVEPIEQRLEKIKSLYSEKVKQKWQTQMTPIKEAVIVLDRECFRDSEGKFSDRGIVDNLKKLNQALFDRYRIQAFQTYIHFDEGKKSEHGVITSLWERNLHAHVVYDWQDKETGKMAKLGRKDMADIQTLTAETLGLERGVFNSKAERLEHGEYREKMQQLQEELQAKKSRLTLLTNNVKNLKLKLESLN
jgi:hypothetical protein